MPITSIAAAAQTSADTQDTSGGVSPAAIVVPILLILLAAGGIAGWLWARRRKQRSRQLAHHSWTDLSGTPAPAYEEKIEFEREEKVEEEDEFRPPSIPPKLALPRFSTSSQPTAQHTTSASPISPLAPAYTADRRSLAPSVITRPYSGIAPSIASPVTDEHHFNWASALFDATQLSRRGSQATVKTSKTTS